MRKSFDQVFIEMCVVLAQRASCARRQVACIATDKNNRIIGSGYNGPAAGLPNCTDTPCPGADCPSGTGLDLCQAIHAEANMLMQVADVRLIETVYCTTAPCIHCLKMLLGSSAKRIVFLGDYPHSDASRQLWEGSGRRWVQMDSPWATMMQFMLSLPVEEVHAGLACIVDDSVATNCN